MKKSSNMSVTLSGYEKREYTKTIDTFGKKKPTANTEVSGTYNVSMTNGLIDNSKKPAESDIYSRCKALAIDGTISTDAISKIIILEFRRMYLESIKGDNQEINIEWFKYTDEVLFNVMQPIFKYMIDRSVTYSTEEKNESTDTADNMKEIVLRSFNNANMFVEFDSKYQYDYTKFYRSLDRFFDTFN